MPTRRTLLKGGAAGLVAASLGGTLAAAGPISGTAPQAAWQRLRGKLTGRLVLPQDSGYAVAREMYFSVFDSILPAGVAYCANVADIRTCLAFAQHHGVHAVARSGGHSYGGYSSCTGLVIDLSQLNGIQIGEHTAVTGPGAQLVDVLSAAVADNVALAGGICPTVAMGGYLQGGGMGWQTRAWGLACDSVTSIDLVLADGTELTVSEDQEPDLFWALRGGGGGNFGIVTSYERRHTPLTPMVNYTLAWNYADAVEVIAGWQQWLDHEAPLEMGSRCMVGLLDAAPGSAPFLIADGSFLGTADEIAPHLAALGAATGLTPVYQQVQDLGLLGGMMDWYKCTNLSVAQCHQTYGNPQGTLPQSGFTIDRSRYFNEDAPASGISDILTAFEADLTAGQSRFVEWFALGGVSAEIPRTATAYVHRDARFTVDMAVSLSDAAPSADEQAGARSWIDGAFGVVDRYSDHETYQNYIDPSLQDWRQAYYAENYPRLVAAKRAYDPHGFFTFPQSIGR